MIGALVAASLAVAGVVFGAKSWRKHHSLPPYSQGSQELQKVNESGSQENGSFNNGLMRMSTVLVPHLWNSLGRHPSRTTTTTTPEGQNILRLYIQASYLCLCTVLKVKRYSEMYFLQYCYRVLTGKIMFCWVC